MTTSWLPFRGKSAGGKPTVANPAQPRRTLSYSHSSAAATLGAPGQSAHALACGYLDGLAQQFPALDAPKTLSVARGAWEKAVGGCAGNAGDARQPRYGRVKRCRRLLAPGTGGDARRPWRLARNL